jgi:hypothetical protein
MGCHNIKSVSSSTNERGLDVPLEVVAESLIGISRARRKGKR